MKNKLTIQIGMLCLVLYFLLDTYTETPDFFLGLLIGLSIASNLVGVFVMSRWIRENLNNTIK